MFEYSEKDLNIYDDKNYTHYGANHPKKAGLAYFDKHVQPSGDSDVGQVLTSVILSLFRKCMAIGRLKVFGGHSGSPTKLEILNLQSLI